jgi:hypothetical protein
MHALACGAALCAAMSMAAQADCLKANTDGQSASGKLASIKFSIPDYALKEQAYILQLDAPACLEGTDEFDKVDKSMRIHVYSADERLRKKLRALIGKPVRVTGQPFGEETAHHHAPIVMSITAIEPAPRK